MAWSHDGLFKNAKRIVDAAAEAKADAICMHLTSVPDYITKDYSVMSKGASKAAKGPSLYNLLLKKNLSNNNWLKLISLAHKKDLAVCAMCNDLPSIDFAITAKVDAFILAPATMMETKVIVKIAKTKKPVLIRIGGAFLGEIKKVIASLKANKSDKIALIYGFQNFPTPLEELNLNFIETLKKSFKLPIGFADHVDGGGNLAAFIPAMAIAKGANIIEKHITHDRGKKGLDYESALDPNGFMLMVRNIREIEKSFGMDCWAKLSEKELRYREVVRKKAVAARDIKKGEFLDFDNVMFKRANAGIYPDVFETMIGKKTTKVIKKDESITFDVIR